MKLARSLGIPALLPLLLPGCSGVDDDACKGQTVTCVSISLSGAGVSQADQLQVFVRRAPKVLSPMSMPMQKPQDLPFKVAVLWPDGAGQLSVRSFLGGALNGVTPEVIVDLSSGAHAKRGLALYPPLPAGGDMAGKAPDLAMADMSQPDLAMADLAMPDLSAPDLAQQPDLSAPDLQMPDLSAPDLSAPDLQMPDMPAMAVDGAGAPRD